MLDLGPQGDQTQGGGRGPIKALVPADNQAPIMGPHGDMGIASGGISSGPVEARAGYSSQLDMEELLSESDLPAPEFGGLVEAMEQCSTQDDALDTPPISPKLKLEGKKRKRSRVSRKEKTSRKKKYSPDLQPILEALAGEQVATLPQGSPLLEGARPLEEVLEEERARSGYGGRYVPIRPKPHKLAQVDLTDLPAEAFLN